MNSVLFRSIAEGTDVRYFDRLSGDIFLVLVKIIRDLDKNNSETSRTNIKSDRFQVFLLIGVRLCYLWSFCFRIYSACYRWKTSSGSKTFFFSLVNDMRL